MWIDIHANDWNKYAAWRKVDNHKVANESEKWIYLALVHHVETSEIIMIHYMKSSDLSMQYIKSIAKTVRNLYKRGHHADYITISFSRYS